MDRQHIRESLIVLGATLLVVGTIGIYNGYRNVGELSMWALVVLAVGFRHPLRRQQLEASALVVGGREARGWNFLIDDRQIGELIVRDYVARRKRSASSNRCTLPPTT